MTPFRKGAESSSQAGKLLLWTDQWNRASFTVNLNLKLQSELSVTRVTVNYLGSLSLMLANGISSHTKLDINLLILTRVSLCFSH